MNLKKVKENENQGIAETASRNGKRENDIKENERIFVEC